MSTSPNVHHRRERSKLSRLFSKLRILPEGGLGRPQVDGPSASFLSTAMPQAQTQAITAIHHIEHGNFAPIHGVLNQISNQISETHMHTYYTTDVLWDSLPRQQGASGHRSTYLGGSRDDDVTKIRNWVETASSELVLWIYGPAGVGKSTLAREVSRDFRMAGLLGAFTPLGSLPNDARDPESVIKIIAREIGETYPQAIPAITNAISMCKGTPVDDHLRDFVGKPVLSLQRSSPVAVILDAFDEWEFGDVLTKDLDSLASLSSVVRFILLGRSDPKSLGHRSPFTRPYCLQTVSTAVMEQYFDREFERVEWDFGRKPSATDVSRLAEQADGLFIWASTACSLLGNGRGLTSPNETLEGILYSRKKVGETGHLGSLYGGALRLLFPEKDEQWVLKNYLGTILVLQEPLPLDDFSFFSGLSPRTVSTIQTRLGALHIKNPIDTQPMVYPATSYFHLSFVEYLQHELETAQPSSFASPSNSAHSDLAKACLRVLSTGPPGSQYLSQRQWYAARHWVSHVSEGAPEVRPGSSSDWEAAELCSLLVGISSATWDWWRGIILGFFIPGFVMEYISGGGDAGDFLQDVAKHLDWQNPTTIPFSIACLSVATRLQPDGIHGWRELGWAYLRFAEISSSSNLLHRAVAAFENVAMVGDSSDPVAMREVGIALRARFERLRVPADLDRSISLLETTLTLCRPGHLEHPSALGDLADSLSLRFDMSNHFEDLQEAIVLQKQVLALCPSDHPHCSLSLSNLASSLWSRFGVTSCFEDLQEAIILEKEALTLRPSGHPHRSLSLSNLSNSLSSRFGVTNSFEDLQEAIVLQKEALALRPSGHPDRSLSLSNLASSLGSRFGVTNSFEDLQEAIISEKEVLALRPSGHLHRSLSLNNLGNSLHSRFKVTNTFGDLQDAITLLREALVLHPPGHRYRSQTLENLADALESRSRVTGSVEDMYEASTLREDVASSR